jgi:hypothetical protein
MSGSLSLPLPQLRQLGGSPPMQAFDMSILAMFMILPVKPPIVMHAATC